jgi:Zn-dependent protease
VGLAGPIWGLAATLVCQALHLVTGAAALSAIARVSAWLNLFNLLPVWQLDGGRGFQALSKAQRWVAAAAIGLAWAATAEGLLLVLLLAAAWQAIFAATPREGDRRALVEYVVLVSALSALTMIKVPGIPLH